ncbi:MAG: hypothetical protein K9J27_09140 [Bacteroidales bacterium]|nr:hypothetical protein [Bacteroidales bacterium]
MTNQSTKAVTFIIIGSLLQLSNGINGGWSSLLVAIFGFIMFYVGLSRLKTSLDEKGAGAVKFLMIAAIIGAVGSAIDLIPLVGIVASIFYVAAFVLQLIGYIKFKASDSLAVTAKSGVTLLLVAMGLGILAALVGIIPLLGALVVSILSIASLILVLFGWIKIQDGLVTTVKE